MDKRTTELLRQAKNNPGDIYLARGALRALERSGVRPPRWLTQRVNPMGGVQKVRDIKSKQRPGDTAACVRAREIVAEYYTNPWPELKFWRKNQDAFYSNEGVRPFMYVHFIAQDLGVGEQLSGKDGLLEQALRHQEHCSTCRIAFDDREYELDELQDDPDYQDYLDDDDPMSDSEWLERKDEEGDEEYKQSLRDEGFGLEDFMESRLTAPQRRLI